MSFKDLAVSAASEKSRHEAEVAKIELERDRSTFQTEALAWLRDNFVAPDEFVLPDRHRDSGYVRFDDLWFQVYRRRPNVTPANPFGLKPTEPCPSKEGEFHYVDASLFGLSGVGNYDQAIFNMVDMGNYLGRVEQANARGEGPYVRCSACGNSRLIYRKPVES